MKTKAAIIYKPGEPVVVEEVDLEGPREREVLVRVVGAGVCRSDYHRAAPYSGLKTLPWVLGHEGAGVVEAVGPGVRDFSPGDHVIFMLRPMCGKCRYCTTGRPNLCSGYPMPMGLLPDGTTRFSKEGKPIYYSKGTFTQYTVVTDDYLVKIPQDVPLQKVALIGCGVLTGVGAVVLRARVETGATVAVWGCGGVGLNVVQGAVLAGASKIIAVDVVPFKLEMARKLGATHTVNASEEDPVEKVRELTDGEGADYTFDVSGLATAIRQAFDALAPGGTCVMVGGSSEPEVRLPARSLFMDRTFMGTFYGAGRPRYDFLWLIELYRQGRLRLDDLVSRVRPLEEVNEAFRDMEEGKVARTVLDPWA